MPDLFPEKLNQRIGEDSRLAAFMAERGETMKCSKFTDSQTTFILRQADEGTKVAEVCRQAGVSQQTSLASAVRRPDAVRDEAPGVAR